MHLRVVLLFTALPFLPISAYAQTPIPSSCQLPSDPKAVSDLAGVNPTIAVNPQWNGVSVGMIPSDQPITLHLMFPANLAASPVFKISGKLTEDAGATWQDFPMKGWQPAADNKNGDLVLEPVPDAQLSPAPFSRLHLVVAACIGDKPPALVGRTEALISLRWLAFVGALAITLLFYVLGAQSMSKPASRWARLSPLNLVLDGSGRASLSQMQIIFFSVIVLFLVSYILLRTGILASLSNDVLMLLGIAGAGSLGGQLATNRTLRVSFDNWSWMKRKGWLADGGFHVEQAQWGDLFSTNDVFDPYRFQMLSFSFVIGISLMMIGLTDLANFSIPTSLVGVIGLSQVTYIGGKITAPATFSDLDTKLTALRAAQDDFLAATADRWVPLTPAGTPERAAQLDTAKQDNRQKYTAFKNLVGPAYDMFTTLFKLRGDNPDREPDP